MTMRKDRIYNALTVLAGALLMGFLWRARGTHGWGSSWGVLNAGYVFALFLNFAVKKKNHMSLPLITTAGLSFMLTCPAWGTLLNQITGVLSAGAGDNDPVTYDISPASGIMMMLLLGFGLASVYGILIGRGFGEQEWKLRDYAVILIVFIAVDLAAKATVSHLILRLIEPQAVTAFTDGLKLSGADGGAYATYMSHFSAVSWAKKINGGRNYFQSVGTISLAVAAAAVLLASGFIVKDKRAARTGAVTCGAFAFAITVSDLFFYFGNGGYRMAQGYSLPENFAAWSLWEYFTGFIAGGIITYYLIRTDSGSDPKLALIEKIPAKPRNILTFLLCVIGGIGINIVRPLIERIENVPLMIISVVIAVAAILATAFVYYRKKGVSFNNAPPEKLSPVLCLVFTVYIFAVYMFIGRPNAPEIAQLHNILFTVSAVSVSAFCAAGIRRSVRSGR